MHQLKTDMKKILPYNKLKTNFLSNNPKKTYSDTWRKFTYTAKFKKKTKKTTSPQKNVKKYL